MTSRLATSFLTIFIMVSGCRPAGGPADLLVTKLSLVT